MQPSPGDLTPIVGSQTDVAPLGSDLPKPDHEKAAGEGVVYDWDKIANDPDFAALKAAKRRFIVPTTIFFFVYYMTLPILVGFFPAVMKQPVLGKVNLAYLFALSQFLMTWTVCVLYVRIARRWDIMNAELLAKSVRA